jgi:Flp pilus assembly protein TadD
MDPNFSRSGMIACAYTQKGMYAQALDEFEKHRELWGSGIWSLSMQAYVYGRAGQTNQAEPALDQLLELHRKQPVDAAAFVWAYLGTGNQDEVFSWLGKAVAQHSNLLATLKVEPALDPIRNARRFTELLRGVGLN